MAALDGGYGEMPRKFVNVVAKDLSLLLGGEDGRFHFHCSDVLLYDLGRPRLKGPGKA